MTSAFIATVLMDTQRPNLAAPVNAPVTVRFDTGRAWRRVTEQRRSAS